MASISPEHSPSPVVLRRILTLWPLIFYGLGVIVGAGIYVAMGAVLNRAGTAAPLSFLLAGIAAGLTGLCYAELAGRFPEASGSVAYVRHGFQSERLAGLILKACERRKRQQAVRHFTERAAASGRASAWGRASAAHRARRSTRAAVPFHRPGRAE